MSPVALSTTTNGIAPRRSRMSSAVATYSPMRSGAAIDVYHSRHSSPSAAACCNAASCSRASGCSVACLPISVTGAVNGMRRFHKEAQRHGGKAVVGLRVCAEFSWKLSRGGAGTQHNGTDLQKTFLCVSFGIRRSSSSARHEYHALEQMHVLFVLE